MSKGIWDKLKILNLLYLNLYDYLILTKLIEISRNLKITLKGYAKFKVKIFFSQ